MYLDFLLEEGWRIFLKLGEENCLSFSYETWNWCFCVNTMEGLSLFVRVGSDFDYFHIDCFIGISNRFSIKFVLVFRITFTSSRPL